MTLYDATETNWLHRGSLKWDRLEKGREEISGVMQVLCYLQWLMVMFIFSNINGTLHLRVGLLWLFSGKRVHLPIQETWFRPLCREDPLEEEMATHSSILAWEIPWIAERGKL